MAGPPASASASAARAGLRRRPLWRRFLRGSSRVSAALILCFPLFVATAGAAGGYLLLFGGLPGTVPEEKAPIQAIPSIVLDGDGNQIAEFRQFDLTIPMLKEDIPQVLKDAVVSSEDQNFWTHKGMDPEGVIRALLANQQEGETVQGGSTITQQYVRKKYLSNERTKERKFNEILLATRLERDLIDEYAGDERKAKEEILYRYLDSTYFGGGAYGVAAAARTYFHKALRDLTLSEAATLAAVIPSPSRYGPRENPQLANERRLDTLRLMAEQGRITQEERDAAGAEHLWYAGFGEQPGRTVFYGPPPAGEVKYPYFVDYLRQYLLERYGPDALYRQGLRIEATIDPKLQALAERSVANGLGGVGWPIEMSLVSMEPVTGYVKALVGGRDFNRSQVNLALGGVQGMQPGSSFKAFTIAKAFEDGYGPDKEYDAPNTVSIGGIKFKGGAGGRIDLRQATAGSVNTYFVQLVRDLKPNRVAELAYRVGVSRITPGKTYGISLTLGSYEVSPLDMAQGYAVFANHGVKADATPVKRVIRNDGRTLEDNTAPRGVRVLAAPVADWTTEMLKGPMQPDGTGKRAAIDRPSAGKTGTAENYTAAWFVGYTPQLATAIWIGNMNRPTPMYFFQGGQPVMGGTIPAITWHNYMAGAMEGLPVVDFATPGVLPVPTSGIRQSEQDQYPTIDKDCGGFCFDLPIVTTPPAPPTTTTTVPGETPGSSSTTTTVPPTTTSSTLFPTTTRPRKST